MSVLHELVKKYKSDVLFLMETLVVKHTLKRIGSRLGFDNVFGVDRIDRGRGLAMLWKTNCKIKIVYFSLHHVDIHIKMNNMVNEDS